MASGEGGKDFQKIAVDRLKEIRLGSQRAKGREPQMTGENRVNKRTRPRPGSGTKPQESISQKGNKRNMCFICRVITGEEPLEEYQARHLKPVAAALFKASREAVYLAPEAIEALGTIAKMRGAPDAPEVCRLLRAYEDLRAKARAFNREGVSPHATRADLINEAFSNPGENSDIPEVGRAELADLREKIAILADDISRLNVRALYFTGGSIP